MSDVLLGVVTAALLAGAGLVVATTARIRELPQLVLAAYVVAFAEIVGLVLVLSAFEAVTRRGLFIGLAGVFAAAVTAWFLVGTPRPPRVPLGRVRALGDTPELLVLAVANGLGLGYVVALIVGTPPNNWDSLSYHLARAVLWSQENQVGYIADAYDERLNANPPHSEIALTYIFEVGSNERLAGFVQFAAALSIAVGVFALARKLDLTRRQASFGGLLVLTLPIVLLQASTTQNDLVAASFLVTATVFLVGDTRRELVLAALATALAVGTKIPAAYGVPLLAAVALIPSTGRRLQRFVAVLIGATVGSYWYVVNLVRTGDPLGDLPSEGELVAFLEPTTNVLGAFARTLDAFDLSGAVGMDVLVYIVVAVAVAVVSLVTSRGKPHRARSALVSGSLTVAPVALLVVHYSLWRVFAKLHDLLEAPDESLPVLGWEAQTTASDSISWFGPLGFPLVVGVAVAAVPLVRRKLLAPLALVLAAAPIAWFVLLGLSLAYDEWQGRFFVYPVALSASLWGLVLQVRPLAVAVVAVAVTTAALCLMHFTEKPSGLRLLEAPSPASVWNLDRWQTQSLVRREMGPVFEFVETRVPRRGVVALALGEDDFGYPPFGERLERVVELVQDSRIRGVGGAEWLLANPERSAAVDRTCWDLAFGKSEGWKVFRRSVAACPS